MSGSADRWTGSVSLGRRSAIVRRRRRLITVLVMAASAGACAGLAAIAGWSSVTARLDHVAWWCLAVVMAAHVVAYAGYLLAHHAIANRATAVSVSWRRDTQIEVIGFGVWLPAGGFALDRRALQLAGLDPTEAAASVVALAALELAVLTPVAWVGALLLLGVPGVATSVSLPWVIGVPVGFGLALAMIIRGPRRSGARRRHGLALELAEGLRAALRLLRSPRRGPRAVAGIAVYWAADVTALWASLRFVGETLAFPRLIVAYATGYIFTRRTLPFGGVVVTEAMLAVSLGWVGLPLSAAVVTVLVARLSDLALTGGAALASASVVARTVTFVEAGDDVAAS